MPEARNPEIRKVVGVYKELSDEEAARMRCEAREWARRDFESLKDDAIREREKKWQDVVASKDAALADKDAAHAAELADKDAQIAALQALIKSNN